MQACCSSHMYLSTPHEQRRRHCAAAHGHPALVSALSACVLGRTLGSPVLRVPMQHQWPAALLSHHLCPCIQCSAQSVQALLIPAPSLLQPMQSGTAVQSGCFCKLARLKMQCSPAPGQQHAVALGRGNSLCATGACLSGSNCCTTIHASAYTAKCSLYFCI